MAELTFAERLRAVAAWLDAHPDVPEPYSVSPNLVHWFPANATEAVAVTKAFGAADKSKETATASEARQIRWLHVPRLHLPR